MSMPPLLTIAIPTVNRARLLGRAIESALAQTSPDIEILVSDNGSTDDTPAIIQRYAGRGLRTFRHPTTMDAARHGQFLIEQARGEYFLGLSDDDYLEPEFAAHVLAMFEEHPEVSFVYTGCAVHYENVRVPAVVGPPVEAGLSFLRAHYAGLREISWCACVTRLRDLRDLEPQPSDRVIGDMYFWTKLALRGPVGSIPCVLSNYILLRSQNDNISHGTPPAVWGREAKLTANEVLQGAQMAHADAEYCSRLRSASRQYVARTTANQFVWCRIRGASTTRAWSWVAGCLRLVYPSPAAWLRLVAALVLPRRLLRSLLLTGAERLSKARMRSGVASSKEWKSCPTEFERAPITRG
jgi:GT2 family glycosyltransferase